MIYTDFKPMLACNINIADVKLPMMGSLKMEGVRAEFTPDGLYTRPLKRFNNSWVEIHFAPIAEYCRANSVYMEGEIYIHGKDFSTISSICRRSAHPDTGSLQVHIFDMYTPHLPFEPFSERFNKLVKIVEEIDDNSIFFAPQFDMQSHEHIAESYQSALDDGFEGFVLKSPTGRYKKGRGTKNEQIFARLKPEETFDGIVVDIIERKENLCESEINELGRLSKRQDKSKKASTGLAAVAVVQSNEFSKPVRVSLTRGIKDYSETSASASRAEIWQNKDDYIGKNIRFVGFRIAGMELPRSPRFDAWRTDLD